ncbi:MAG: prenyltransferase/squalene oxidase repeat-containing protein [Thermogutta sp.]
MRNSIDLFFHFVTRSAHLSEEMRLRHRQWLVGQQRPDGGFAGREGDSNLYYTGFGARLCAILWSDVTDPWVSMTQYVAMQLEAIDSAVDLASAATIYALVRLLVDESLAQSLEDRLRARAELLFARFYRPDGGFAKSEQSGFGSTYATFLALNTMNLLMLPLPDREQIVQFVCSRQRPDGGFAEVPHAKNAATNPTAAAISILADLEALDKIDLQQVIEYLFRMQRADGGFSAGPHAPVSDLLSTCAALSALWLLDRSEFRRLDVERVERFVQSLENATGGFRGCLLDDQSDVEYTFYGLATRALLHS